MFTEILSTIPQRLVYFLAALCLLAAIILAAVAHRFFEEDKLSASGEIHFEGAYSRLWFPDGDGLEREKELLASVRDQDGRVHVHALDLVRRQWAERRFDASAPPDPSRWALDSRGEILGWITGGRACVARHGAAPSCTALDPDPPVRGVHVTPAGAIVAFRSNGEVAEWMPGRSGWAITSLDARVDQVAALPGYVAVLSASAGKVSLYRRDAAGALSLVESRPTRSEGELRMAGLGQVALLRSQVVYHLGEVSSAPGRIRALAYSPTSTLLAVGEFGGVRELHPRAESTLLAEAQPDSDAVAASSEFLAHSGPSGTSLHRLSVVRQLNEGGRVLMGLAQTLGILGVILGVLGLFLTLQTVFGRKASMKDRRAGPLQLPPPPTELVEAISLHGGVLWAGAGLSAQSGLPQWPDFVAQLLQTAVVSGWTDGYQSRKLAGLHQSGDPNRALELLLQNPLLSRLDVLDHYKSVYHRFCLRSRSHEALAKLPLRGAISTNYDRLVESIGAGEVIADLSTGRVSSAARNGRFFVFKLYGDLRTTKSALLTRKELYDRGAQCPDLGVMIGDLMARHTMLFIGASLHGLVADLEAIGAPRRSPVAPSPIPHFAVAGVQAGWEKYALLLEQRYGIRTLACDAELISGEMPAFLDLLVTRCDSRRAGLAKSAVSAAHTPHRATSSPSSRNAAAFAASARSADAPSGA